MSQDREVGTVKRFDHDRGFGFIARRVGEDVYVHQSAVGRAGLGVLNVGDQVSFTLRKTDRGWQADNLARVQTSNQSAPAQAPRPATAPPARLDTRTAFQFGPDYLANGYFEQKNDQRYLRPEVLDTLAIDVAKVLGNRAMKSHQLRRFFNKARGIEARLDREKNFEAIKADIYGFKRDVVYQVGRKVVPEEFHQFIHRNVELAVEDEQSFRKGFLQHFESVLAYFVYFFREQ
jgi:CRISPR type III-A-associated protein Csm2